MFCNVKSQRADIKPNVRGRKGPAARAKEWIMIKVCNFLHILKIIKCKISEQAILEKKARPSTIVLKWGEVESSLIFLN